MRLILTLKVLILLPLLSTAAPAPSYDDSPLHAVRFVDRNEGWAVGDQGVIWHTINGGTSWERQTSGTRASLRAIQFLTPYTGFIVGRVELPNAAGSQGIVLSTIDGGITWREVTSTLLPGLNAVQFFDENRGVVAGDGTDAFPTGAFTTSDAGKTWKAIEGSRATSWNAIDFVDTENGILCNPAQSIIVSQGRITTQTIAGPMEAAPRNHLWIGTRLLSRDPTALQKVVQTGSATAQAVPFPPDGVGTVDQRSNTWACTVVGEHVWAANRPGSVIFHSPDFGKTWETQKTPSSVPLHSICFADEKSGWAVGSLGTILRTTDGGKTWILAKCGGQRAAVLFTHARSESIPLNAIARLGGENGYLCSAVSFSSFDDYTLSAAMRMVGGAAGLTDGSVTWPGYMTEAPADREPGMLPMVRNEQLLRRLVLHIRTWRPDVIITEQVATDSPVCDQIVLLHLKDAFTLAADPKVYPEQIEQLGVAPHAAKKLYAIAAKSSESTISMDLTTYSPELGDTAKDCAEIASMLVGSRSQNQVHFQLIAHRLPGSEQHRELLQGIDIPEGGSARRKKAEQKPSTATSHAEREKGAKLCRQLEGMIANPTAVGGLESAIAQIIGALPGLPDEMAARIGVSLGRTLLANGQWTAARELFAVIADKYAAHPEAVEAVRWMIRYHASGEVRRRLELGHFPIFQKSAIISTEAPGIQQVAYSDPFMVKPAFRFTNAEALRQWNDVSLHLETKLLAFGAGYALDPTNNLCLVAARRNLGLNMHAVTQLKGLVRNPSALNSSRDPWQCRLADEMRILANQEPLATPAVDCTRTTLRPFLDGKHEEDCWKSTQPLKLQSHSGTTTQNGYSTEVRVTVDDKFLYVLCQCQHPEGKQVPRAAKRQRDEDLNGHDRVELYLDLDRDYQSYYRLRVDHRGCVADDCWGDASWNPKWFVAMESTNTCWTTEIAIPLAELSGTMPANGDTWGFNAVRIVPGVGVDSWGGTSDRHPKPSAMGLLRFTADKKSMK